MNNKEAFEEWFNKHKFMISQIFFEDSSTKDYIQIIHKAFLAACKIKDKIIEKIIDEAIDQCPIDKVYPDDCVTQKRNCVKCITNWAEKEVKKDEGK